MLYAYCEHYVLPLGSREAGTLAEFMEKLPGDDAQKLSQIREAYAYMITHPGCMMMSPGREVPAKWRNISMISTTVPHPSGTGSEG